MKKRILPLLLSLVMLISLFPVEVMAAEPEMTITAGTVEVTAGDTDVEIPISVVNAVPVMMMGLEFILPEGVTLKKMTAGEAATTAGASVKTYVKAGTVNFEADNNITFQDGTILTLIVDVSSAASGSLTIQARPIDNNAGMIANEEEEIVPVAFVPGTITVKANTTDRTVTFMNGTEAAATKTVANGGKLTEIPAAPAAVDGQSFLGWYAVEGTNYVLSSVDDTITGTEASTDAVITADTTYHAIWASDAMIAAGYAADASGKTTMSAISTPNNLQTLITACNNGKVKLLSDVDLGSNHIEIAQGKAITLDLNGKTLSSTDSNIPFYGSTTPCGTVYVERGTLTLYSSAAEKGTVHYTFTGTGNWKSFGWGAVENFGGTIPVIKNVTVKTTTVGKGATNPPSALFGRSYFDETANNPAFESVSDCAFICNNGAAFTCVGDSGKMRTASFQNCTFTGTSIGNSNGVVGVAYTRIEEFTNCEIQANANSATDGTALSLSENAKIISVTGGTMTAPNGIYTTSYYGDDPTAIEKFNPNSVTVTAEDGFLMNITSGGFGTAVNVNLNGGKYSTNKIALEEGTTVTYPAGQQLLQGADGWYTLQTAYTVTFKNGDTVLQTVTCGKNGTAAYTGSAPTKAADETYTYTFNGKWADESGNIYTGNQVTNVTSDLTVTAQFDTASAKVVTLTVDGNSKNYTGLKAAAAALNASGDYKSAEIKLIEDTVETSTVEVKKSVTLDLNGHTLTIDNNENGITVSGGATLTFKDSVGTGIFEHTATSVEKSAILANGSGTVVNIESGTIEATTGNALTVDDAAFHVSGGMISGGQNGICVKTQNSSPECTISNGKILCSGNGHALYMDQSVAKYIKLSGGAFKSTLNPTEPIRKFNGQIKCAFQDGKSLSPSPNTEGFYEVREVGTYTFVLKADKEHYNAGEPVTVTVSAYGPGKINSFGFTPSYDSGKLELKSVTSANDGNFTVNPKTGMSGYTVNGKNGITLGNKSDTATELVTITFTAKGNIKGTATITLNNLEMTGVGTQGGDKAVAGNTLTVNLHDIRVTLTAANGTINGVKDVPLYAKYNVAGLYSDAARKAPATVDVSANEGYRLNDKQDESLWLCGDTGYASFDAIKSMTFTESKTFALQTTKVWTVSFNTTGMTGGSLSTEDPITVDKGTKLSAANLPTPTPDTGYTFTGWKVGTDSSTVDTNTYVVDGNITLTPVFTAQSYDFTCTKNHSTVSVTAGVEADKATYGQSVTFTVTPNNGYVVESVGYRIGDQATALTTISPDQNGVYTIEGSKITGKVTVEVVTKAFYAVTFTVDSANTYTLVNGNKTFYAKEGTAGLYTDQTFTTRANAPAVTAADGYRLADELKNESLWYAGKTSYTTASLFGENATATFNSAVTIYAKTVQQCTITFAAGDHGALADTATLIVDAGTKLEAVTKPKVTPDAGYAFDKWSVADDTAVIEDMTVTAMYKHGTYSISLPDSAIISVSEMTGFSDANKVVHGIGVSFKLTVNHGYLVSSVSYKIGEGKATTVNKNADGTYTISIDGAAITGDIAVTVESQQTVDVAFDTDGNGSVAFAKKTVVKDSTLGEDNVPTVTPNSGYQFEGWYKDSTKITNLANERITSAVTYTAKFTHATYSLTLSDGLTLKNKDGQSITTATHGTALIFTPTVDGKVVTGITAKIGETDVTVTENADGSYTIAGNAITGALAITAQTVDGSWSFIDKEAYKALSANTQIALLTTGQLASGNYLLGSDGMYWSSKYDAYVKIVDVNETVESLTAKLSVSTNAEALTLAYTGDINGDGKATPADGGMINDELLEVTRNYSVTEKMRLEMDFSGDRSVSTADIMSILRKYVGLD